MVAHIAGLRPGSLASDAFGPVAIDAERIHDLLVGNLFFRFECINAAGSFRNESMAELAIGQPEPMPQSPPAGLTQAIPQLERPVQKSSLPMISPPGYGKYPWDHSNLLGGDAAGLALDLTFAEVEFFATGAELLTVHFVRKNLFFLAAGITLTHEGFQVFIGLKSGAVLRCVCHRRFSLC
jgi:hypothetical protein